MSVKFNTQSPSYANDPMQEVLLLPCFRSMDRIFAEKHYGKIIDGFCELTEKRCEVCNKEVEAYASFREIYDRRMGIVKGPATKRYSDLYRLNENGIFSEKSHVKIKDDCNEKEVVSANPGNVYSPKISFEETPINLPYPGPPAVFEFRGYDWDRIICTGSTLCRKMGFMSKTDNSVVRQLELLGYDDKSVRMSVTFKKKSGFKEYLESHQIFPSNYFFYITKDIQELKLLFAIISSRNKIPDEQFKQMSEIVECAVCYPINSMYHPVSDTYLW